MDEHFQQKLLNLDTPIDSSSEETLWLDYGRIRRKRVSISRSKNLEECLISLDGCRENPLFCREWTKHGGCPLEEYIAKIAGLESNVALKEIGKIYEKCLKSATKRIFYLSLTGSADAYGVASAQLYRVWQRLMVDDLVFVGNDGLDNVATDFFKFLTGLEEFKKSVGSQEELRDSLNLCHRLFILQAAYKKISDQIKNINFVIPENEPKLSESSESKSSSFWSVISENNHDELVDLFKRVVDLENLLGMYQQKIFFCISVLLKP